MSTPKGVNWMTSEIHGESQFFVFSYFVLYDVQESQNSPNRGSLETSDF